MNTLADRIRSEAAIADRPGQMGRLETIAAEVEAAEATIARIRNLADEWQGHVDAVAITYQNPDDRKRATGLLQHVVNSLRAALDPQDPA